MIPVYYSTEQYIIRKWLGKNLKEKITENQRHLNDIMRRNAQMQFAKTRVTFVPIFTPNRMQYVFSSGPFRFNLLFNKHWILLMNSTLSIQFSAFMYLFIWSKLFSIRCYFRENAFGLRLLLLNLKQLFRNNSHCVDSLWYGDDLLRRLSILTMATTATTTTMAAIIVLLLWLFQRKFCQSLFW